MARKTVARSTELARNVTLRIDFFKVTKRDNGLRFETILARCVDLALNQRVKIVNRERILLHSIESAHGLFHGEIARLRMYETPSLGSVSGEMDELPLRQDQGVAERTAFLFDPATQIIAIHAVREAVSASRLAGFCDEIAGVADDYFTFEPVVRPDVRRDFRRMDTVTKLQVKVAEIATATKAPAASRASTRNYLRLRDAETMGAQSISITITAPQRLNGGLLLDNVKRMAQNLLDNREALTVTNLVVAGRHADDEMQVLDLINGRLREEIDVQVRGRSASYEQRRNAVLEAFQTNRKLFGIV